VPPRDPPNVDRKRRDQPRPVEELHRAVISNPIPRHPCHRSALPPQPPFLASARPCACPSIPCIPCIPPMHACMHACTYVCTYACIHPSIHASIHHMHLRARHTPRPVTQTDHAAHSRQTALARPCVGVLLAYPLWCISQQASTNSPVGGKLIRFLHLQQTRASIRMEGWGGRAAGYPRGHGAANGEALEGYHHGGSHQEGLRRGERGEAALALVTHNVAPAADVPPVRSRIALRARRKCRRGHSGSNGRGSGGARGLYAIKCE
jgi:hypothetical protein